MGPASYKKKRAADGAARRPPADRLEETGRREITTMLDVVRMPRGSCALHRAVFFFFQAEDGIRDLYVTGFRRVLFRSSSERSRAGVPAPRASPGREPPRWMR